MLFQVSIFRVFVLARMAQDGATERVGGGTCESSISSLMQRQTRAAVGKISVSRGREIIDPSSSIGSPPSPPPSSPPPSLPPFPPPSPSPEETSTTTAMTMQTTATTIATTSTIPTRSTTTTTTLTSHGTETWNFSYTLVEGKNCYGDKVVNRRIYESGELTLEECKAFCSGDLGCDGIQVTTHGSARPKCWLKSGIDPYVCEDSTWSNIWTRSKYPIGIEKIPFRGKTLMHIMPWFGFKDNGAWASHWTMKLDENDLMRDGRVASHITPLIGPYSSANSQVVQWQLRMMKLAGVDGVVINWYGTRNKYDFPFNLRGSNEIAKQASAMGMLFTVCYEDWTAVTGSTSWGEEPTGPAREEGLKQMQQDFEYIRDTYMLLPGFVVDNAGSPVILIFGPRNFHNSTDWTNVLGKVFSKQQMPTLFPLQYAKLGDGRFSWFGDLKSYAATAENENQTLGKVATYLSSFYTSEVALGRSSIGSSFAGFRDYYVEGGSGESYGMLPDYDGHTLHTTMNEAKMHQPAFLQLVTWNDYGEGTCFEPTKELLGSVGSHFNRLLELQELLTGQRDEDLLIESTCKVWDHIVYNHSGWPATNLCGPRFSYILLEGKNCYGDKGVTRHTYESGEVTLEECKAACSRDVGCDGIQVTTHGNARPKCWLKSGIDPDGCDDSTWSDIWLRTEHSTITTSTKLANTTTITTTITANSTYILVEGKNCYGDKGVTRHTYESGELTLEECKAACSQDVGCDGIQVTTLGNARPKCWLKSGIDPDGCDDSTWSDIWLRTEHSTITTSTKIANTTTITTTITASSTYILVEGKNCYGDKGVTRHTYESGELTLEECKAACSQDVGCDGIQVTTHGNARPTCWLKSGIDPDTCDDSSWSNVWIRSRKSQ